MFDATTFRPRNGLSAESYWRVREWCERNGFTLSDVLNAVIIPLAYYLNSHCHVDPDKSMATVTLNIGELPILHVLNGRMYPLATQKGGVEKNVLQLTDIQAKVKEWEERNAEFPADYDEYLKRACKL